MNVRAAVVDAPGAPEVLVVREHPMPDAKDGWVLIRVRAFGLNRAELFTRQGHSPGVRFPRVIGIECVGEVVEAPGTELTRGQKVAAMMGGMGRAFDGSYAEYTCVPVDSVHPVSTDLPWETFGAIPEMFQTVWGSLHTSLGLQPAHSLLIRGGTSSIGMTAARMAKQLGTTVIATTRRPERCQVLLDNGADHALVDGGELVESLRQVIPDGVDRVLELVGTVTLRDSLRCARKPGGVVCMTGILGNAWAIESFEPMTFIPSGVHLTSYSGNARDISTEALQRFVADVAADPTTIKIDRVFSLDQIAEAHAYMESNRATGKLVVVP